VTSRQVRITVKIGIKVRVKVKIQIKVKIKVKVKVASTVALEASCMGPSPGVARFCVRLRFLRMTG
jgi:hypothetical protein